MTAPTGGLPSSPVGQPIDDDNLAQTDHAPNGADGPDVVAAAGIDSADYYQASQSRLVWWRFRRHKVAVVALFGLLLMYLLTLSAEFVAPYSIDTRFTSGGGQAPSTVHVIHEGQLHTPFVYATKRELSHDTFRYEHVEDTSTVYPIRLFAKGDRYELLGLIPADRHLFTVGSDAPPLFLFGSDQLGRDLFSRIVYGGRVSLTIGLVGIALGFVIGVTLGAVSGYFGGLTDTVIQRVVEFVLSLPTIPLWMVLSASLPRDWSVIKTYFFITLILSLVSWAGLAREVRGKMLALREEDFVTSARLVGATRRRVITVHLIPSFASHLIVVVTLGIPGMILGETALSFLGLGMQPPAVSWGVLLQDAQKVVTVTEQPWLLIPALFIVVAVLLFNFLGDGLRDAADPYST